MAYWWVNHGQTILEELEGGYIWSPQENRNGSRNQTYINLTKVQIGDVIFSYAHSKIKAIGLVENHYKIADKPAEFGSKGEEWNQTGWLVDVKWETVLKPLIPKNHLKNIVPLLPMKYSPIQSNGNGNQGCYLAEISDVLGDYLLNEITNKNPKLDFAIENDRCELENDNVEKNLLNQTISETEKAQLIKSRRGQGIFRMRVSEIETKCRVTSVDDKSFLIASHIKPWRKSSNAERLDGNNGLLLSPHVDRLFDNGWISFSSEGDIICSNPKIIKLMSDWGINPAANVGNFTTAQAEYMKYHRAHILKK
ncbi:MAG: HNH endonuclease signature motif containing protein [Emcibacteraceae bacterium]